MNIRTFAQQSGVSKDTLRFYEKTGLIVPSRGENHYRDYTQMMWLSCRSREI